MATEGKGGAPPAIRRPAGPRKPRIMRTSATHVAGYPWGSCRHTALQVAATVSQALLLKSATAPHRSTTTCPAGVWRS
uniref:Uncharacterized protein n=1 Tax=Leersia perrieri TaxID=77586 RepID=A0A0D9V346_9ORYZ